MIDFTGCDQVANRDVWCLATVLLLLSSTGSYHSFEARVRLKHWMLCKILSLLLNQQLVCPYEVKELV